MGARTLFMCDIIYSKMKYETLETPNTLFKCMFYIALHIESMYKHI